MSSPDDLVHVTRPAADAPAGALVLLHGRGTSEHDLAPLLDVLDPRRRLLGLAPRGPLCLPPGGAHWYAVRQIGYPDPDTFLPTFARLAGWLDAALAAHHLELGRTVVGGFSQGAVMSHALAFGPGRPAPAGVLALSGFMPTVEGFELLTEDRTGFPVAVGHGVHDEIIGVEWGRGARDRLETAGAEVLYRESTMAHTIDPRELPTFGGWLERVLP